MQVKRQNGSSSVYRWMEKDVRVSKLAPNLGIMRNDTRQSVMLNRQFFSDMYALSSERFRKISEYDMQRKKFIKNQQVKAETNLPGLLPYIENHTKDVEPDLTSRNLYGTSNQSYQSPFLPRSHPKIGTTPRSNQIPVSAKKGSHINATHPMKGSFIREKTFNSINRLAKPKGRNETPVVGAHVRPKLPALITADDLFGSLDDFSNYSASLSDKPKTPATDRRFQRLIHLFSDVHEREPSNFNSVRSIVESNPSLQSEEKQWEQSFTPNIHNIREENYDRTLDDDYLSKTGTHSTELTTSMYDY